MNKIHFFSLFCLFLSVFGCELENPEKGIAVEDVIIVKVKDGQPSSILADGISEVEIVAELGPESDANKLVTFTTNEGTFVQASGNNLKEYTVSASSKTAFATLRASNNVMEKVTVTAKVGDFVNTTSIRFDRALPTDYNFDISPGVIANDKVAEATMTVKLYRNGEANQVSDGTKIEFMPDNLDNARADYVDFIFATGSQAITTIKSKNGLPGKVLITPIVQGLATTMKADTITFQ
jgi:hypothetical protein